jgi:hypothetical protein
MAVWSAVRLSQMGRGTRLDPEFYQPYLLTYESQLRNAPHPVRPLGDLVTNGYRVVYENTEILDLAESESKTGAVRFLQADDIHRSFPAIDSANMGWVSRKDWDRYPKGRVNPGELLIEVKGLARKVAIVPSDFPRDTLVSGSVFKLQTRPELLDPYFLLAYLLSSFGVGFRYRCLTNTLIGFVNKEELYAIPVVIPPLAEQRSIARTVLLALESWQRAAEAASHAETNLMQAIGLDGADLSPQKCYSRRFHDLQTEARFDAEYFNPKYQRIISRLRDGGKTLAEVAPLSERVFSPPAPAKSSSFRYIEIGSLTGDGQAESETLNTTDAPSRATWVVKPGDIITSTVRPIRRLSAMISEDQDGCVCSSGFAVLTPKSGLDGIEPEVLLTYLRLPVICEILDLHTTASMYPAIPIQRLMQIPILVPDKAARSRIVAKVRASIEARRESIKLLSQAKSAVEEMIAGEAVGKGR